MPSRARRLFLLVVSIRQHTQAEAHTRSQTRGVRETEEMRARCSFLIPAPQGSTRQYESFSSLALTCTFSGVVFDEDTTGASFGGLSIGHPHPRARVVVKKEKKKEKKGEKEREKKGEKKRKIFNCEHRRARTGGGVAPASHGRPQSCPSYKKRSV